MSENKEIRPICLYVNTCIEKRVGKRDCKKCEHHLNYWTEVTIRDMEANIIGLKKYINELEQENEENKHYLACMTEQRNKLQTENEKKDNLLKWLITQQYYIIPKKLKQKITEVLNG